MRPFEITTWKLMPGSASMFTRLNFARWIPIWVTMLVFQGFPNVVD